MEKIRTTEEYLKDQRNFSDSNQKHEEIDAKRKDKNEEIKKEDGLKLVDEEEQIKDWTPDSKCYFCLDGKLDSENNTSHGTLVGVTSYFYFFRR